MARSLGAYWLTGTADSSQPEFTLKNTVGPYVKGLDSSNHAFVAATMIRRLFERRD